MQTMYCAGVKRSRIVGALVRVGLFAGALIGCEPGDEGGAASGTETDANTASGGTASEGESEPVFETVIDHAQWESLDAIADPLADHRPDPVECGLGGWYLENDGLELEIDMLVCNYLALRQSSLRAIEQGKLLRIGFYHFDLVAPEPAQGHLQLSVDGELVWDYLVDIPSDPELGKTPADFVSETFPAPFSAPAGSEVLFHVHNHGQNTWALRKLEVEI